LIIGKDYDIKVYLKIKKDKHDKEIETTVLWHNEVLGST
jgi:hypothetical protein